MTSRCVIAYAALTSVALLSACTGSTPTNPASLPSTVQAHVSASLPANAGHITGWIEPTALSEVHGDKQRLYISDVPSGLGARGFVNVYVHREHASALRLIGNISGLDSPTQIAVDRFENVYVIQADNGAPVLVFKRDAIQPFRTLNTEGKLPFSIGVATDGTVYVGTVPGLILVYAPGSNTPTTTLQTRGDGPNQLFLDRDGNLYYEAVFFGGTGGVISRFAHGSTTSVTFNFPDSPIRAALLHDGDMAIEPLSVDRIDRFERGNTTTIENSFSIPFAQSFCLNQAESELYTVGAGTITTFAFPEGRSQNSLLIGGPNDANFGCASSPARHLPRPF